MKTKWMTPAALVLGLTACGRAPVEQSPRLDVDRAPPAELALGGGARYDGVDNGGRLSARGAGNSSGLDIQLRLTPAQGYVTPRDFCDVYVEATCSALTVCGCEADKVSCYDNARQACEGDWGLLGPQVQNALASDTLTYDGFAAFRFLEEVRQATDACAFPLEALQMDRARLLGVFDVFTGHVPPGGKCDLPFLPFRANECAGGLCVDQGGGGPVCVPIADLGDACDAETICVDLAEPVEVRDLFDGTLLGRCAADGSPEHMTCQPRLKVGRKCAFDLDCASTRCVAEQCAPLAQPGEGCQSDLHCAVGHCQLGLCADPRLPLDAECGHHAACASGACFQGRCAEPLCRR